MEQLNDGWEKYLSQSPTVWSTSCLSVWRLCHPNRCNKLQNKKTWENEMMSTTKYLHANSCDGLWSGHVFGMMFFFSYLIDSPDTFLLTAWIPHFLELGVINHGGFSDVLESQLLTHPHFNSLYYTIGAPLIRSFSNTNCSKVSTSSTYDMPTSDMTSSLHMEPHEWWHMSSNFFPLGPKNSKTSCHVSYHITMSCWR